MIPFTTVRKLNIENVKKYVGYEGDYFDIVIEEKPLPNHWVPMQGAEMEILAIIFFVGILLDFFEYQKMNKKLKKLITN